MKFYEDIKQLIRYVINFGLSAATDLSLYSVGVYLLKPVINIGPAIIVSVIVSRILSSFVNFTLNKSLFNKKSKKENKKFLLRYYTLWLVLLILSATLTYLFNDILNINELISKIIADSSLGIFSYYTQKKWVFASDNIKAKGIYFKIVRSVARLFIKREIDIERKVFEKQAVLIGHHQNFYGPISALVYMPDTVQLWTIDHLFSFKTCFDKYYNFTFKETMKLPSIVAVFPSLICALVIPPFLKSAKAIPVYRGSKNIIKTFKSSVNSLENGNQILIFPDIEYDNKTNTMKEVYEGFLSLDKQYFKKQKEHLEFVPLKFNKKTNKITNKREVVFLGKIPFQEEKKKIENEIINLINS